MAGEQYLESHYLIKTFPGSFVIFSGDFEIKLYLQILKTLIKRQLPQMLPKASPNAHFKRNRKVKYHFHALIPIISAMTLLLQYVNRENNGSNVCWNYDPRPTKQ